MNPEPALFTIQPAGLFDLNDLRRLESLCFQEDAWPVLDLMGVLTLPGIVRLKAVMAGRMVGFVAGDKRDPLGIGWITTLGVDPEYRHQGVGRGLLEACEEQMGLPRVRLTLRRSNLDAYRLYQKAGYSRYEVWPQYYSGGEDGIVMQKVLGESKISEIG